MPRTSVLVTGANKGLGYETARRLGESGWTVFLGSRDEGRGRAAVEKLAAEGVEAVLVPLDVTSQEKLAAEGVEAVLVPLDVTSQESVDGALRLVREHTDRLDVLVNNAGNPGRIVPPADATVEDVHLAFDTNVYGVIRVTRAFLPLLRAADNPRVVMVSSAAGSFAVVTDPDQPVSRMHELAYTTSKAALNMLTVRYAQALPEIKFNAITPGEVANRAFAATDMNNNTGTLTVTEGTDSIVRLATIGPDGPTGTFADRCGPVAW